jgi:hypothetical protein
MKTENPRISFRVALDAKYMVQKKPTRNNWLVLKPMNTADATR